MAGNDYLGEGNRTRLIGKSSVVNFQMFGQYLPVTLLVKINADGCVSGNNTFAKVGYGCAFDDDIMVAFAFLVANYPDHSYIDVLPGKYHNNYIKEDNHQRIFVNYVTIIFFIKYLPLVNVSALI